MCSQYGTALSEMSLAYLTGVKDYFDGLPDKSGPGGLERWGVGGGGARTYRERR